jgi:putative ABC transport system permease protein
MSGLRQILTVTRMNLINMPHRLGNSSVVIIGNAGVVAVLVSVLAMAVGFGHTINNTGRPDRVIVMRGGSNSELTSVLSRAAAQVITDAPGLKKDESGRAIASTELVLVVEMTQKGSGNRASVTLRGVGAQVSAVRPETRIIAGRWFVASKREIVVGHAAQMQFNGLEIGNRVNFGGNEWLVVGAFDSNGDLHESEVLTGVESIADTYRRSSFNSISALLENEQSFDEFKNALISNPQLSVEVVRESDYFDALAKPLSKLLTFVGYLVGGIMSVGAIFGALNTIYAAVSSRRVEIATLRALGFGSDSVAISVIVEALILAIAGGAVGALLAWGAFNGNAVNTLGSNHTQVVFHLMVTPALILLGMLIAAGVGLVGGLIPAVRAARLPVATALRAL